jgi:nitrite reductase/ring-hydroxylating ferredoxin subunit
MDQLSSQEPRIVRVCRSDELAEGGLRGLDVDGQRIGVARSEGRVHAFSAVCPHLRHDLSAGFLAEGGVTCNSHLWHFELETGSCSMIPGMSIPIYPVREEDGWVVLEWAP